MTRDAATVITPEDTAVALGFNAPTVTDAIDQTGPATGDNPERLGLISLTWIRRGATLQDALGNNLYTIPATGSATVTRLSDAANLITVSRRGDVDDDDGAVRSTCATCRSRTAPPTSR